MVPTSVRASYGTKLSRTLLYKSFIDSNATRPSEGVHKNVFQSSKLEKRGVFVSIKCHLFRHIQPLHSVNHMFALEHKLVFWVGVLASYFGVIAAIPFVSKQSEPFNLVS